jgi:ATP-dependent 26S proteasome regulatory subunit
MQIPCPQEFCLREEGIFGYLGHTLAPNACKSILLLGTPGIGKTISGFLVAHEADFTMVVLQGSSCIMWCQ